jgi:adhesin/invasin
MHRRISVTEASLSSGRWWSWTLTALAAIGASACSDNNNITTALTPTTIQANSATNGQTGVVGTALAQPVAVIVADQNGAPLANATVNWAVTAGGGSVASATSVTDATGNATVVWTLGTTVGTDSLMASIAGGADAIITATATAAAASAVHVTSADTLTVTAGATTAPLVVRVVDQFGNPISGATVTWAVTGGGTLSASTSTTDATGSTQVTLTTAATPGSYTVTATAGALTPVTFTITGT